MSLIFAEQKYPNTSDGDLVGPIGLMATVFHHLAPIPVMVALFRKQITVDKAQGLPLIAAVVISFLYVVKGFQEHSPTIFIGNCIGVGTNSVYFLIYLSFLMDFKYDEQRGKAIGMFFLYTLLILLGIGGTAFLLAYVIQDDFITSMIAMTFAIIGFIPGILNIISIFKSSDYKKISMLYCIAGVINSGAWFMYGLIGTTYQDPSMIVPNAIGVILNLLCISMRDLFKSRTKGIKINPLIARANTTVPNNNSNNNNYNKHETSQEEHLI